MMSSAADPTANFASSSVFKKGTVATCLTCGKIGHRTQRCVAHLLPDVILASTSGKKHRLEELCRRWRREAENVTRGAAEAVVANSSVSSISPVSPIEHDWQVGAGLEVLPSLKEPELIFLRTPTPNGLVQTFQRSPLLNRHFFSLFVTKNIVNTMDALAAKVLADCEAIHVAANPSSSIDPAAPLSPVLRVQSYPKAIRAQVLSALSPRIQMNPRSYTHVLFVVQTYGKLFFSLEGKELYILPIHQYTSLEGAASPLSGDEEESKDEKEILSRAYHKMAEAFMVDEELPKRIKPGCRAIDIGASPGGWSDYLSRSHSCHVLAIDPGVVHCSSPLVRHVSKLVENSLPEIQEFATAEHPLDLIVCDMNVRPEVAVSLIAMVCEKAVMSRTAQLVFTCKETSTGRSKKLVQDAQLGLSDYFGSFRSYHLLSNGKERTLIGEFLTLTEEQRNAIRAARELAQAERQAAWDKILAERKEKEAADAAAGIVKKKKKWSKVDEFEVAHPAATP